MATSKIKKGDTVQIIAGKDSKRNNPNGKHEGKVLSVKDGKVLVEGCNLVKKHTKPNQNNTKGGILDKESAIDVSNVMLVHKGKTTRVGFKFVDGKKVRVAKATGEVID